MLCACGTMLETRVSIFIRGEFRRFQWIPSHTRSGQFMPQTLSRHRTLCLLLVWGRHLQRAIDRLLRLNTCFTNAQNRRRRQQTPHRTTYWIWCTVTISANGDASATSALSPLTWKTVIYIAATADVGWNESPDNYMTVYEFSSLFSLAECCAKLCPMSTMKNMFFFGFFVLTVIILHAAVQVMYSSFFTSFMYSSEKSVSSNVDSSV